MPSLIRQGVGSGESTQWQYSVDLIYGNGSRYIQLNIKAVHDNTSTLRVKSNQLFYYCYKELMYLSTMNNYPLSNFGEGGLEIKT